jgi:hypothetical protein
MRSDPRPGGTSDGGQLTAVTAPATPEAAQWQGWGTAMKPAHEPCVWARKPFNAVPLSSEANRLHHLLGGLLWLSLSPAKRAELTSQSSRVEPHVATCASALAAAAINLSPGRSDATATFRSLEAGSTSLSIASSWSGILAALSDLTRTFTTSTKSSMTTGLRILNSLLAPLTSQITMPACECLRRGRSSAAPSVESSSSADWSNWLHTLSRSVPESVTESTARAVESALAAIAAEVSADQAADDSALVSATTSTGTRTAGGISAPIGGSSAAFEPVVVARKPLAAGTVAANVLEFGTGAINVDGCRIGDELLVSHGGGQTGDHRTYNGDKRNGQGIPPIAAGLNPRTGRWPANVVLDVDAAAELDAQSGELGQGPPKIGRRGGRMQ